VSRTAPLERPRDGTADVVAALPAEAISWELDDSPKSANSARTLELAIRVGSIVDDTLAKHMIEELSASVGDLRAEVRALRLTLAVALAACHSHHNDLRRLRESLNEIRSAQRRRSAA